VARHLPGQRLRRQRPRSDNITGNVWEWCADAWSDVETNDPLCGVSRGGSYLCHASYCRRYRVSARQRHAPDSTTGNLGFRLAAEA
jgi:formylglycine-generating enzyme required for sulfatase activity